MILEQITEQLTETLTSRVLALFGHAVDRVILQAPPKLAMGDLATPLCLELAKALKRKPREIAEIVMKDMHLPMFVQSVAVEGAGYLNFRFDRGAFTAAHIRTVMAASAPDGERVIVEHTNINPNKAAHIGHIRNAVLGDTYVRLMRWLGYRIPQAKNRRDHERSNQASVVHAAVTARTFRRCHRDLHSQPPVNPARSRPLTMYGHLRINRHNKPVR